MEKIFLSTNHNGLSRAECLNGEWEITRPLEGLQLNCLITSPLGIYAGTQAGEVLISRDRGINWARVQPVGVPVKSLAVHSQLPDTLFAGCKLASLYVSHDAGGSWEELPGLRARKQWWWFSPAEPPDWRPYVQALTISPDDPNVMLAGIELGGVLRSEDGGKTWSKHRRGAVLDCHSLMFHPVKGEWVYEGGGSGVGTAFSRDGGKTWKQPGTGLGKKYGWMVAADPARPEVWYLSASEMPSMLKGEFVPPAHVDGNARAHIYRSVGGAAWEQLSGGLPDPLAFMAYALVSDPAVSGHLYAGLANGDVWHTADYGDHWMQLPFNLGGIHRTMIMV